MPISPVISISPSVARYSTQKQSRKLGVPPWLGENLNQGPKMKNTLPRVAISKDCGGIDNLILVIGKTLFPLQQKTPGKQNWSKNS